VCVFQERVEEKEKFGSSCILVICNKALENFFGVKDG
jgi:hypothetical protein